MLRPAPALVGLLLATITSTQGMVKRGRSVRQSVAGLLLLGAAILFVAGPLFSVAEVLILLPRSVGVPHNRAAVPLIAPKSCGKPAVSVDDHHRGLSSDTGSVTPVHTTDAGCD